MKILKVLSTTPFNSIHLINTLKSNPTLANIYSKRVRHYILQDHTILVLNEYEKYFANRSLPNTMSKEVFRILLALHDIGKPFAFERKEKHLQGYYSCKYIDDIWEYIPFGTSEKNLIKSIIENDPIGLLFQNKITLDQSILLIKESCNKSGLSINIFFHILCIYYQSDAGSYTKDAGGLRFLEYLFVYIDGKKLFDETEQRLKFSPQFEEKYNTLKRKLI